jgi:hypothetical protein
MSGQPAAGPFETERQALDWPAVRAVDAVFEMTPHNLAMLTDACTAAGVELGAYDRRILGWLAGWEPTTCAVVAGIIARAAAGAPACPGCVGRGTGEDCNVCGRPIPPGLCREPDDPSEVRADCADCAAGRPHVHAGGAR